MLLYAKNEESPFVYLQYGVLNAFCTLKSCASILIRQKFELLVYSYSMPVCSIVKTITPRCRGRPDALLHEAEGRPRYPRGNSLTILQTGMK